LPSPVSAIIGREREIAEILDLLDRSSARLLTLTGPAGVGKTRLAIQVRHEVHSGSDTDTFFVPLAPIHDPELVLPTIAQAFGIRESSEGNVADLLRHVLSNRPSLLVLDNLEHLRDAHMVLGQLVSEIPDLTVLATSRTPLRLSMEQEYPVDPLPWHSVDSGTDLPGPAVELFVQRAKSVRPVFERTADNARHISELCQRLDGLPLALELAAARINVLSPEAMLTRFQANLDLLSGGPRDQSPRLQSIRAALDWSFDLLEPGERSLFMRLSIFPGSFALDAAEALAGDDRDGNSGTNVLDGMASLVDKSLLRTLPDGHGEPRFGMLATIRDYGRERLNGSGGESAVRATHAEWYLRVAEAGYHAFRFRTGHEAWLTKLDADRANLRDALEWFRTSGDATNLARLAGYLYWFWDVRGPLSEGRVWLERALESPAGAIPDDVRFQVMLAAGQVAHFQGDDERASAWSEAAYSAMTDSTDPWTRATPIMLLGLIAEDTGDYQLAEVRFSDALRLFREADDPFNTALATHHLGVTAWGMGDVQRAVALCEEALAEQRRLRDTWHAANSLGYLGLIAIGEGQFVEAATRLRESLDIRWRSGASEDLASSIADFAALASATGDYEIAVRLSGAADTIRHSVSRVVINLPERTVFEDADAQVCTALSPDLIARLRAEGANLTQDDAVQLALKLADRIQSGRTDKQ
jgi:predicted ATPase